MVRKERIKKERNRIPANLLDEACALLERIRFQKKRCGLEKWRAATTIGLILSGQLLYSQSGPPTIVNGYCVKTKSLTRTDLEKIHPFDKTTKIQLVSFKPDLERESSPMKNGTIDTTQFIERKALNQKEQDGLIDILYNYNFDPRVNPDSIIVEVAMCYMPRNAVIFRNKANEIITYLEVCFECLRYENPKNDLNIVFCQDKYDRLRNYFGKMGIKFGVTEHE